MFGGGRPPVSQRRESVGTVDVDDDRVHAAGVVRPDLGRLHRETLVLSEPKIMLVARRRFDRLRQPGEKPAEDAHREFG